MFARKKEWKPFEKKVWLVIASKTGSFVELIENEIDGLLFDYNLTQID